jgi:hypothetical protein
MLLYNNVAELRQYHGTILLSGEKASLSAGDSLRKKESSDDDLQDWTLVSS